MKDIDQRFETSALHGDGLSGDAHNAIRFPVYSGVAFEFENAEDMEAAFNHRKRTHVYSRITNPTIEHFEKRLTLLENGLGSIALSSGMAALSTSLIALMQPGDNLIASKFLFGNTYSLLRETLATFGIESRFVDIRNCQEVEQAIDKKSRLILFETITNPQMIVPDVKKLSTIAEQHGLILVADGTVTTPYLFKAKDFGVNLVIHSTTKYISGGATSVGGAIVDLGNYDWRQCPALKKYHKYGQGAFIARLRMEVHRNLGSCMSPQSAYLQTLGLETLALRVKTSCDNCLALAQYLKSKVKVRAVYYPGLPGAQGHELSLGQFSGLFGGVLSFELASKEEAFLFLNTLQLIRRATNINDNKSLIIHPASTIFSDCSEEEKADMSVTNSLLRLSAGIENIHDLIADLNRAFAAIESSTGSINQQDI